MMTLKIWKDIPSYEGAYQVSNNGRVKSVKRYVKHYRGGQSFVQSKILKPRQDIDGYMSVILNSKDSKLVHRLVLETFDGPCPEGMETRHLNGNPADNRLENLCWGTSQQNEYDKIQHGTSNRGDRNGHSKLAEKQVRLIREEFKQGASTKALSKKVRSKQRANS